MSALTKQARGIILALATLASAPIAAQTRQHRHDNDAGNHHDRSDPLARYERLTERVDRKNAKAHEYERDTPAVKEWKRRQEKPMDDDEGED